jgi:hypothetical protein
MPNQSVAHTALKPSKRNGFGGPGRITKMHPKAASMSVIAEPSDEEIEMY